MHGQCTTVHLASVEVHGCPCVDARPCIFPFFAMLKQIAETLGGLLAGIFCASTRVYISHFQTPLGGEQLR